MLQSGQWQWHLLYLMIIVISNLRYEWTLKASLSRISSKRKYLRFPNDQRNTVDGGWDTCSPPPLCCGPKNTFVKSVLLFWRVSKYRVLMQLDPIHSESLYITSSIGFDHRSEYSWCCHPPSDLCAPQQGQANAEELLLSVCSLVSRRGPGWGNGDMDRGARQSAARSSSSNHSASRGPFKVTDELVRCPVDWKRELCVCCPLAGKLLSPSSP